MIVIIDLPIVVLNERAIAMPRRRVCGQPTKNEKSMMLCLELGAASSSPGRGQVPTAGCHSLSPSVGLPFLLKFLSFFSTLTEDTSFSFFLDDCCIIKDDDQALRAKVLPRRRIKPGSWLAKERKGWMVITADTRGAHLDPIFLYNKRRCIPWWWPSSLVFVPAMLVFLVSSSVGKTEHTNSQSSLPVHNGETDRP